jgi:hypothetical protein
MDGAIGITALSPSLQIERKWRDHEEAGRTRIDHYPREISAA